MCKHKLGKIIAQYCKDIQLPFRESQYERHDEKCISIDQKCIVDIQLFLLMHILQIKNVENQIDLLANRR